MPALCWFDRNALDELHAAARHWPLRETGGALLGWREEDQYVVSRVLGPGPDAKHGFGSFEPDGRWQSEQGAETYRESGRTIAYLGDWHTHPRGAPVPSQQDRKTAKMIAEDPDFRSLEPLYAIVGKRGRPWARKWKLVVYRQIDGELVEIELCVKDAD